MGFNTVAILLNDRTHEIAKDGPLGARIATAMRNYPARDRFDCDFGAGQVISQAHADYTQIVVVAKNTGRPLGQCDDLDPLALDYLKEALERHGYRVTKRRQTKAA